MGIGLNFFVHQRGAVVGRRQSWPGPARCYKPLTNKYQRLNESRKNSCLRFRWHRYNPKQGWTIASAMASNQWIQCLVSKDIRTPSAWIFLSISALCRPLKPEQPFGDGNWKWRAKFAARELSYKTLMKDCNNSNSVIAPIVLWARSSFRSLGWWVRQFRGTVFIG